MTDALAKQGLQTAIWNNNLRSLLLLAAYPFILAGVVFASLAAYGYFNGGGPAPGHAVLDTALSLTFQYWPIILTVVAVWFMISYFFQGAMIRGMAHAHPVTRGEEPDLYNLVENLCISQGQPMPRLEIVESHARNAFASGIDRRSYTITVTRGLMQSLSKDELEGVLAHELTHILNRDVRLMMVCIVFTGMLGIAAQLLWSNLRYALWLPSGGNNNERRSAGGGMMLLLVIGAILWVGYFATILTRLAISRRREYMADAGAVKMTKNPDAMMRALIRIAGADDIPKAPADIRALCFENRQPFLGLFATHPPIASRVQAISDQSGLPVPDVAPKLAAGPDDAFVSPWANPGRDNWTTRRRFKDRRGQNPWV